MERADRAARLAWGRAVLAQHMATVKVLSTWQCAGCQKLVAVADALVLPDGNRVHYHKAGSACLIRYGEHWRSEAERMLMARGMTKPSEHAYPVIAHLTPKLSK